MINRSEKDVFNFRQTITYFHQIEQTEKQINNMALEKNSKTGLKAEVLR